ncbi:histidine phosphatase family protein [Paucibacter sp. APW11]|uniref:Histidine phosphatase family protein n=1 Tax=Roseateles aquae TaxID=3077235 RepID=A0ABU3PIP2_9BURK|nr:histidine phosphatase family protein [Paucibacter sp. APW11]MDT9002403.1 histidine phosphatase family protein [Paucibacter sp. APW11]
MTELILIRHGETDWNRRQCFQGQIDVPLNERGLTQAARLGQRLAEERQRGTLGPVARLISSDLGRARQTAGPAAEALGLALEQDARLREQAFGILEGLSFADIRERHPAEFERWASHDPAYALPGGAESRQVFHARVTSALLELAAAHEGQVLLVVTHGGVLDMVWRSALGHSLHGPRDCAIPNAGINRLRVHERRFEVLSWAEDEHLIDLD